MGPERKSPANAGALEIAVSAIVPLDALTGAIAEMAYVTILPEAPPETRRHYWLKTYANCLLQAVADLDEANPTGSAAG